MRNKTAAPTTPDKSAPEKGMELLPCPLCEGEVKPRTDSGFHYGDRGYKPKIEEFECTKCNLRLYVRGDEVTKEQAFAQWNTRTTAQETGQQDAQETGQQDAEKAEALAELNSLFHYECPFWVASFKEPRLSDKSMDTIRRYLSAPSSPREGVEELKREALTEFMKGRNSKGLRELAFEIISETFNWLFMKGHLASQTRAPDAGNTDV